jgi:multiple sugar transport system substrate-binding protein
MPDSSGPDRDEKAGGSESVAPRVSVMELAILEALCRQYIEGQPFASPAPDNKILKELANNEIFLNLDMLRTHLGELNARLGVEENLPPHEKRIRLAQRAHDERLIPGWHIDPGGSPGGNPGREIDPTIEQAPRPGFVRRRPRAAAGGGALAIGLGILAFFLVSSGHDSGPLPIPGPPTGQITYCTGEDVATSRDGTAHQHSRAITEFNNAFPTAHAKLLQFHDAVRQYEDFSRDLSQDHQCDVLYSDVTWTADFANNHWLRDLSRYFQSRLNTYVPAMRNAAVFDGRMFGVPKQADAGLLYYRTDHVKHVPPTWQALYQQAEAGRAKLLRYQGNGEGLTVSFLELAYAAGADDVVTPDHKAHLKQPATLAALQLMVDGIKKRGVPIEVATQIEDQSLYAFGKIGKADFMRQWPYAFAALQDAKAYPKAAGHFGVAALPRWEGQSTSASVLGGHVLVVSAATKNLTGALNLVNFLTSKDIIKRDATDFSLAPALSDLWDDPQVQQALPASGDLRTAIFGARTRPVTPNYQAVSEAIYKNVNRALSGALRNDPLPADALDTANYEMQKALDIAYPKGS